MQSVWIVRAGLFQKLLCNRNNCIGRKKYRKMPIKRSGFHLLVENGTRIGFIYTYQGQFSLTDLTPLSGTGNWAIVLTFPDPMTSGLHVNTLSLSVISCHNKILSFYWLRKTTWQTVSRIRRGKVLILKLRKNPNKLRVWTESGGETSS